MTKKELVDICSDGLNRSMHLTDKRFAMYQLCPYQGKKQECVHQGNLIYFKDLSEHKVVPAVNGHYPSLYKCTKDWNKK